MDDEAERYNQASSSEVKIPNQYEIDLDEIKHRVQKELEPRLAKANAVIAENLRLKQIAPLRKMLV